LAGDGERAGLNRLGLIAAFDAHRLLRGVVSRIVPDFVWNIERQIYGRAAETSIDGNIRCLTCPDALPVRWSRSENS
ncbi:MAG: hypothetical protein WAM55_01680, partial [Methylovirgula sp.]